MNFWVHLDLRLSPPRGGGVLDLPSGTKFLLEFIFANCRFFCVLRELIFAIRADWFFLLGINLCDFQKVPSTQHLISFVFIEYVQ